MTALTNGLSCLTDPEVVSVATDVGNKSGKPSSPVPATYSAEALSAAFSGTAVKHVVTDPVGKDVIIVNCTCPVCAIVISSFANLKTHLATKHRWRHLQLFRCEHEDCMCSRSFTAEGLRSAHYRAVNKKATEHVEASKRTRHDIVCTHSSCNCGALFTHVHAYQRHIGEKSVKCDRCSATFVNAGDLSKHRTRCLDTVAVVCDQCGFLAKNMAALIDHANGPVHVPRLKLASCDVCGFADFNNAAITKHKRAVHVDGRLFKCPVTDCVKDFKDGRALATHMATVHEVVKAELPCSLCSKVFRYPREVVVHQRLEHGNCLFKCRTCTTWFSLMRERNEHELEAHTALPPLFACDACGVKFHNQACHDAHVASVHAVAKEFVCPETDCSYVAFTASNLSRHTGYCHGATAKMQVPGRSEGERIIYVQLTDAKLSFDTEFRLPSLPRLRFDFYVKRPGLSPVLVEYDGYFHYHPYSLSDEGCALFLGQVHRDLIKTRVARANSMPLLRLRASVTDGSLAPMVMGASVCPRGSFDDYVDASLYTAPLAKSLRAYNRALLTEDFSLDAMLDALVSATDVLCGLPVETCMEYIDAVVTLFVRQYRAVNVLALAEKLGSELVVALLRLSELVPEFAFTTAVVPPPTTTPPTSGPPYSALSVSGAIFRCWHAGCFAKFEESNAGADSLMAHLHGTHPEQAMRVRCAFCDVCAPSFQTLVQRTTHADACKAKKAQYPDQYVSKVCRCGLCPATDQTFSSRNRLYAHFNERHNAHFSQFMTLKCPICGATGIYTPKELRMHLHVKHSVVA
jgi:hypothetical protein